MNAELRDAILAKCEPVNDCLEWTGGCNSVGHPIMYVHGQGGGKLVRRVLAEASGIELSPEKVIRMKCGNPLCMNVKHMHVTTRRHVGILAAKAGRLSSVSKSRGCFKAALRRAKLDADKVRAIRESEETTKELAELYGVSIKTIYDVRTGASWRCLLPMGAAGLMTP